MLPCRCPFCSPLEEASGGLGGALGHLTADPAVVVHRTTSHVIPRAEPTVAAPVRDRSGAGQARRTSGLHPGLFSVSIVTPRSSSQIAVPADRTVVKIEWRSRPLLGMACV